jgi:hypothetical protein
MDNGYTHKKDRITKRTVLPSMLVIPVFFKFTKFYPSYFGEHNQLSHVVD